MNNPMGTHPLESWSVGGLNVSTAGRGEHDRRCRLACVHWFFVVGYSHLHMHMHFRYVQNPSPTPNADPDPDVLQLSLSLSMSNSSHNTQHQHQNERPEKAQSGQNMACRVCSRLRSHGHSQKCPLDSRPLPADSGTGGTRNIVLVELGVGSVGNTVGWDRGQQKGKMRRRSPLIAVVRSLIGSLLGWSQWCW